MEQTELSPHELLKSLRFCIIDLETTGGNPLVDRIIEIGMVKIENLKLTEERDYLINPEKEIPEFIQKLTSIKNEDVANSPKIHEVLDEISQFIGDSILVAHNTSFDIPFINAVLKLHNRPQQENKVLCTNIMTKYMIPDIVNSNLNFMAQIFGLEQSKAHRAIEDARATASLLLKYLDIFEKKNIRKVNQLYYPRNRFELDRVHFEEKKEEKLLFDFLKTESRPITLTVKGDNGVILAYMPIENPAKSLKLIKTFLKDLNWSMVSIKLCGPFIEALVNLNQQFLKMPEGNRERVLNFLNETIKEDESDSDVLEKYDFLISPHLIQGQLVVYTLMGLSPYSQLTFKYPAHKKKLSQFLGGQVVRFEQSKQRRKTQLLPEILPFITRHLGQALLDKDTIYNFQTREVFKKDSKAFFASLESMIEKSPDPFTFPDKHF